MHFGGSMYYRSMHSHAQPGTCQPTCLPSQRQPDCLHYLRLHYLRMSVKDYFPRVTGEQPPEVFQHVGKVGESCFLDKGDRFQKPYLDPYLDPYEEARKRNTPSGKPANRGWIFDFTNSDSDSTLEPDCRGARAPRR